MLYNYNNTVINIYIDKCVNGQIFGRIFSPLMEAPIFFTDAGNMLLQIEEFLDKIGYPCAFQKLRSFFPQEDELKQNLSGEKFKNLFYDYEKVAQNDATVVGLRVTSRQNASWQGFMELGTEKMPFKSALQFLKMIYALAEKQSKTA